MDKFYLDRAVFELLCDGRGWASMTIRSERLGVGRTTLHRWYRGEAADRRTAGQVSKALGVRLDAVFPPVAVTTGGCR